MELLYKETYGKYRKYKDKYRKEKEETDRYKMGNMRLKEVNEELSAEVIATKLDKEKRTSELEGYIEELHS